MNDGEAVRMLHRFADSAKQEQGFGDGRVARAEMLGQRQPVRILHHKPWSAVLHHACVENVRDGAVVQSRQRPLLRKETFSPHGREPRVAQQLDRDVAADIRSLGKVDHAHAALAEQAQKPVGPDLPLHQGADHVAVQGRGRKHGKIRIEQRTLPRIFLQHLQKVALNLRIPSARLPHSSLLPITGKVHDHREDSLQSVPTAPIPRSSPPKRASAVRGCSRRLKLRPLQ